MFKARFACDCRFRVRDRRPGVCPGARSGSQHRRCRRRCTGRLCRRPDARRRPVRHSATAPRHADSRRQSLQAVGRRLQEFLQRATPAAPWPTSSMVAIASAPWDREGVNNGFNIPTTVFQAGNVIGNFVFQAGAGFATYGVGKVIRNQKAATVGRDIVRAQVLSQVVVQALKYTVRRERPDQQQQQVVPVGSFGQRVRHGDGAAASLRLEDRRAGVCARQLCRARAHVVESPSCHGRRDGRGLRHRFSAHRDDDGREAASSASACSRKPAARRSTSPRSTNSTQP